MDLNFGTLLTKRAQLEPARPAVVFQGRTFSFRELNDRSNRWANAFADLGLRKGDRVGMLLMNCSEFIEAYFGLLKIGAILVPLNTRLAPQELESICRYSGLQSLIFGAESRETVEAIRSRLQVREYLSVGMKAPSWARSLEFVYQFPGSEPRLAACGDDPAFVFFTAGTTGSSKGAVLTHQNLFWWCHSLSTTLGFSRGPVLVVVPLFHGFGINYSNAAVLLGCTTVLMGKFDPGEMLELIVRERVDTFAAVPTMLQRLAEMRNFERSLRSVQLIISGGAPLSPALRQTYKRHELEVWDVYGLTEAGAVAALNPSRAGEKSGSIGLPFHYVDMRVVDENDFDVTPGQVGELLVKGPAVIKEYWNNPEATNETIEDGWFHTGDLVRLDEEGYIYSVDRKKDMIASGAEKI